MLKTRFKAFFYNFIFIVVICFILYFFVEYVSKYFLLGYLLIPVASLFNNILFISPGMKLCDLKFKKNKKTDLLKLFIVNLLRVLFIFLSAISEYCKITNSFLKDLIYFACLIAILDFVSLCFLEKQTMLEKIFCVGIIELNENKKG